MSRILKSLFIFSLFVFATSCKLRGTSSSSTPDAGTPDTGSGGDTGTDLATGTAVSLVVEGPSTGLTNNVCHKLTIKAKDVNGTFIKTDQALTVTMDDNSAYAGNFYSNSTCSTALSLGATVLSSGSSSTDVYYYTFYPVAVNVGASSNPATTVTAWTATLAARDLADLYLDLAADEPDVSGNYTSGVCHGPFNLVQLDADNTGLILSMGTATTIVISNDSGNARFYATSACNTAALTTVSVSGGTEVSTAFYMKGTTDTNITWVRGGVTGGNSFTF